MDLSTIPHGGPRGSHDDGDQSVRAPSGPLAEHEPAREGHREVVPRRRVNADMVPIEWLPGDLLARVLFSLDTKTLMMTIAAVSGYEVWGSAQQGEGKAGIDNGLWLVDSLYTLCPFAVR